MIYGVRVAVSRTVPHQYKSSAWALAEVYDVLMRKHGIDIISWSVVDREDHFVIVGMVPGDFAPELLVAKEAIREAIRDITDGGEFFGEE